jgi:exopolysaccharide biosynthesis WecB/TagA/CpsF family protein
MEPPAIFQSFMQTVSVFDTPLSITSYRRLSRFCYDNRNGSTQRVTVGFTDLNVLFLRKKDEDFKQITDGAVDLFVPDGMSLKLLLSKKGIPLSESITSEQFMRHCCLRSPANVSSYVLGGSANELAQLIAALRSHNPRLNIVGSHPEGFTPEEEASVVADINRCNPQILWICLPTPLQERFAQQWKAELAAPVRILVGSSFHFELAIRRRHSGPASWRRISVLTRRGLRRMVHYPAFFWTLRHGLREPASTGVPGSLDQWTNGSNLFWQPRRKLRAAGVCARHRCRNWARRATKRAFDLVATIIILLLISPLLAATALTILLMDGQPLIFGQRRIGKDGRVFKLWKFRTMRRDADLIERQIQAHKIQKDEHFFNDPDDERILKLRRTLLQYSRSTKYPRDPRIIRCGRFIRRYSLDELPQFFLVLSGKLSLVGPRPYAAYEIADYGPRHVLRHRVKPGITGPWQISDRDKTTFEESIGLDLQYIREQSFLLDLKLLLKTIPAALKNKAGE